MYPSLQSALDINPLAHCTVNKETFCKPSDLGEHAIH
jgi:hypothetical protein